jgi:uncharacterized protein YdhG (YjbR/CyaY superfamily)
MVAKASVGSVTEYIAGQPAEIRAVLRAVRRAVTSAVPALEESISYRMPTYKLGGRPVLYFAGWKAHYSLYPATAALLRALGPELARAEMAKGTIRVPYSDPLPAAVVARIARFRASEVSEAPKKRRKVVRRSIAGRGR